MHLLQPWINSRIHDQKKKKYFLAGFRTLPESTAHLEGIVAESAQEVVAMENAG